LRRRNRKRKNAWTRSKYMDCPLRSSQKGAPAPFSTPCELHGYRLSRASVVSTVERPHASKAPGVRQCANPDPTAAGARSTFRQRCSGNSPSSPDTAEFATISLGLRAARRCHAGSANC
jgi:hypothetical protein